jgi:N5-(cytidine 5'-diphosphoramidyl)-L-glutamine hydrolase
MKKIAITQRLIANDSYFEVREALDISWGKLFNELDYLPIVLPINIDFEEYFSNILIDGILLTGGNDLNSIKSNKLSKLRDDFEFKLIEYGIINNIPIYGVCRGMQLIAEYFGCSIKMIKHHVNVKHELNISNKSKYKNCLMNLKKVNSFHNYGIYGVGDELLVSAKSEDNSIEAIEHRKYKIFAQMWHSEREEPFVKAELELIKEFF